AAVLPGHRRERGPVEAEVRADARVGRDAQIVFEEKPVDGRHAETGCTGIHRDAQDFVGYFACQPWREAANRPGRGRATGIAEEAGPSQPCQRGCYTYN